MKKTIYVCNICKRDRRDVQGFKFMQDHNDAGTHAEENSKSDVHLCQDCINEIALFADKKP